MVGPVRIWLECISSSVEKTGLAPSHFVDGQTETSCLSHRPGVSWNSLAVRRDRDKRVGAGGRGAKHPSPLRPVLSTA